MFTAGADVLSCYKSDRLRFLLKESEPLCICLSAHQRVHAVNIFKFALIKEAKRKNGEVQND